MSQYFVFDLLVEQCTIMVEFISKFQSLNYFVRHRTNSRQFHPVASGSEYNYMNGIICHPLQHRDDRQLQLPRPHDWQHHLLERYQAAELRDCWSLDVWNSICSACLHSTVEALLQRELQEQWNQELTNQEGKWTNVDNIRH